MTIFFGVSVLFGLAAFTALPFILFSPGAFNMYFSLCTSSLLIAVSFYYGPTTYFGLSNVILRHDLKDKVDPVSEAYPHLILDNFQTKLGDRISDVLKHIFPMPKIDSKRIVTLSNREDFISFRHHLYRKPEFNQVETKELGPRFEMKPY